MHLKVVKRIILVILVLASSLISAKHSTRVSYVVFIAVTCPMDAFLFEFGSSEDLMIFRSCYN